MKTRALVGIVALSALMAGCAVVPAEPVPVSAGVYVGSPVVVARPAVVYPAYGYGYYGYGGRHYRHW